MFPRNCSWSGLVTWKWLKDFCLVNLHTALKHTLTPPDMPPLVFSQSPNPEQIQESVQYYIELLLHGAPFHRILLLKWTAEKQMKQHLTAQRLSPIWPSVYVLVLICRLRIAAAFATANGDPNKIPNTKYTSLLPVQCTLTVSSLVPLTGIDEVVLGSLRTPQGWWARTGRVTVAPVPCQACVPPIEVSVTTAKPTATGPHFVRVFPGLCPQTMTWDSLF